jgi:exodeoxyribonuclease-5
MLHHFLANTILKALPFTPTSAQQLCIERLSQFCTSPDPKRLFLLKGYAGTGKTSVVSALVRAMQQLNQSTVLLAPTGRAAKVFAVYAGTGASSIHKKIYRQKSVTDATFLLDYNKHRDTLFIVDEASMIANNNDGNRFGSGKLLDDMMTYVYSPDSGCRMVLLGDTAQLLPVTQNYSPALELKHLESYGLTVEEMELTEVVRQAAESGILYNATQLRQAIGTPFSVPVFNMQFPDIFSISGSELIDHLHSSFSEVGEEETIIITRSNKQAKRYNQGIRMRVLQKEEQLSAGDLLMITKNNYFWSQHYERLDFIANGDIARVIRIRKYHQMYGCTFVDVLLQLLDYDMEIDCRLLMDTLTTEMPAEADKLSEKLFAAVETDYAHIPNKHKRYRLLREDLFLNALQARFAYAITCHKAQGGQWSHVYVDAGIFREDQLAPDLLPWLYTAVTRAREKLFLVNFLPQFFKH